MAEHPVVKDWPSLQTVLDSIDFSDGWTRTIVIDTPKGSYAATVRLRKATPAAEVAP